MSDSRVHDLVQEAAARGQRAPVQVSFEFFPPNDAAMERTLWESVQRLAPLAPRFVSVTYGADGSTRARTHNVVMRVLRETTLTGAPHLTCIGAAREVLSKLHKEADEHFNAGIDILYEALGKPAKSIADNAGFDGAVVSHKAMQEKKASYGFDSLTGQYVDMLEAGIVDPAKVTKAALQNAVSVAQLLLTTDALIATKPEPKKKGGGPPEGGMDGMDEMGGGGMDF